MIKKYQTFLLVNFFALGSFAQSVQWANQFGSTSSNGGIEFKAGETINDIVVDHEGNTYVIGNYKGLEGYFNNDTLVGTPSSSRRAGVLAKYTPDGSLIWLRSIQGTGVSSDVFGLKVELDSSGNVFAVFKTLNSYRLNDTIYNSSSNRLVYLKLDSSNQIIWHRYFESSSFALTIAGLEILEDGHLVTGVRFLGTLAYDTTNFSVVTNNAFYNLFRLNANNGSVVQSQLVESFSTAYMNTPESFGGDIFVDNLSNVYLLGSLDGLKIGIDTLFNHLDYLQMDDACLLIKFDSSFTYQWHRKFGSSANQLEDMTVLGFDSTIIIGISTNGGYFYYEDSLISDLQATHSFIGVFNTQGDLLKAHTTGDSTGQLRTYITDMELSSSNDEIIFTTTNFIGIKLGSILYYTFTNNPYSILLKYRLDSDSFEFIQAIQPVTGHCSLEALSVGNENHIVAGGIFWSTIGIDTHELTSLGANDAVLFKRLDCSYLSTSIINASGDSILCSGALELSISEYSSGSIYQWKYGTTNISGATDTTYQASIAGEYFLEVSDSVCVFTSDGYTVTNGSSAVVAFNLATTNFCESDSAVVLSGGSPVGGTYFGNGVSGGIFSPSTVAPGPHQLGYVYQHAAGCIDTVYANVQVNENPTAIFFPSFTSVCAGDSVPLNSGFPVGGTYSGTAVSGNLFTPTATDTGAQTLYYARTNSTGCVGMDSISINVVESPTVSFNLPLASVCENVPVLPLSGGFPIGGTYSGEGVAGNFFLPSMTSNSEITITYAVSNGACSATASDTFIIDTLLTAQLPLLDSICVSAVDMPLGHGLPAGGNYFGNGVSANLYTVIDSSLAFDTINYAVTNTCGTDTASNLIQFIAAPAISEVIAPTNCFGDSTGEVAINVIGGVSPYTYSWTNGTTTAVNSNLTAGVYGVTASGENGCVASDSLVVTEPTAIQLQLDSADDVLCNGFSNARAFVTTSGGTAPYTFLWSNGELVEDALSLPAGTNNLTVIDANNCSSSLSIQISELQPVVVSSTISGSSCFGAADGQVSINAIGGLSGYNYNWSNGDSLSHITDLISGEYSLLTTDSVGCFSIDTFVVHEPDSISLLAQAQDVTCFGGSDAQVLLSVSGGVGVNTYAWSNGNVSAINDSLQAGTYLVTVSDSVGCFKIDSFDISQPTAILANIIVIDSVDCYNENGGKLQVIATGGLSNDYSFQWNEGQTVSTIDSLLSGSYTVSVSDTNNCFAVDSVELVNPLPIQVDSFQLTHPHCFGDTNGAINTITSGGTGGLNFTWSNGMSGSSISNLIAASYGVTISDLNGCELTDSATLVDPMEMTLSLSSSNILCFGDSAGDISAIAVDNQGPVSYAWSSGESNAVINSLPIGLYYVTATDSMGCLAIDSAELTEPTPLSLSVSVQNNLCFGDSSGQLSTTVSGGVTPYALLWNNGDTASSIDSLASGIYSLSVTDSNGCLVDTMLQITAPDSLSFVLDSLSNPLCFGDSNGYAEVLVSGGNGTINILWNDGSVSFQRNDLTEGIYSFTISDMNACSKAGQLQTSWPAPLTIGLDSTYQPLCFGDSTGYLAVSAQGGTGALNYTWSNGETGSVIDNLDSGLYSVTITDSNNCSLDLSQTIVWPEQILANLAITNTSCDLSSDGSIVAMSAGGTGSLNYSWSTNDTTSMIDSLSIGDYSLSVTDSLGCELVDSVTVLFLASTPSLVPIDDQEICNGDSVDIMLQTDASSVLWSNNAIDLSQTFINEGLYWVEVEDSNCYTSDTFSVFINELPVFSLGSDTLICVDSLVVGIQLSGPFDMDVYNWNTGDLTQYVQVNQIGPYSLIVIDTNGCEYFDEMMIDSGTCVGINDLARSVNVLVYPNPNRGSFQLEVEGFDGTLSYRFIDSQGKLIQKGTLNQQYQFAFDALPKGLYQIVMLTENGEVVSKAVVVQ
jgi:hypothetical protein